MRKAMPMQRKGFRSRRTQSEEHPNFTDITYSPMPHASDNFAQVAFLSSTVFGNSAINDYRERTEVIDDLGR